MSGCGWAPLGKSGPRSGLLIYFRSWHVWLMSSRQPCAMWGLAPTNMFPSTQKDRANMLEPWPQPPPPLPSPLLPAPPLSKPPFYLHLRLSLSLPSSPALPLLLLHIRPSLSVAASLGLSTFLCSYQVPLFPSCLFSPRSLSLSLAPPLPLCSLIPLSCYFPVLQSFFLT